MLMCEGVKGYRSSQPPSPIFVFAFMNEILIFIQLKKLDQNAQRTLNHTEMNRFDRFLISLYIGYERIYTKDGN